MRKLALTMGGFFVLVAATACYDTQQPAAPKRAVGSAVATADARSSDHVVSILDACDGPSFAAQDVDCSRTAGLKFSQFIAELQARRSAGAWHFAPTNLILRPGQSFSAFNRGGEVHTFTEVEHFGGGIVPALNQLSGNPVPAPECLALGSDDFIPPGASSESDAANEEGTELYQCCIHPWMRATVTVKRG